MNKSIFDYNAVRTALLLFKRYTVNCKRLAARDYIPILVNMHWQGASLLFLWYLNHNCVLLQFRHDVISDEPLAVILKLVLQQLKNFFPRLKNFFPRLLYDKIGFILISRSHVRSLFGLTHLPALSCIIYITGFICFSFSVIHLFVFLRWCKFLSLVKFTY